jgi:hypothetical protein
MSAWRQTALFLSRDESEPAWRLFDSNDIRSPRPARLARLAALLVVRFAHSCGARSGRLAALVFRRSRSLHSRSPSPCFVDRLTAPDGRRSHSRRLALLEVVRETTSGRLSSSRKTALCAVFRTISPASPFESTRAARQPHTPSPLRYSALPLHSSACVTHDGRRPPLVRETFGPSLIIPRAMPADRHSHRGARYARTSHCSWRSASPRRGGFPYRPLYVPAGRVPARPGKGLEFRLTGPALPWRTDRARHAWRRSRHGIGGRLRRPPGSR